MSNPLEPPTFAPVKEDFGVMDEVFTELQEQGRRVHRLAPRKFERDRILTAFDEAFELIGGVPRLALWAHKNPSKFFPLYLKTAGAKVEVNHSGEIRVVSAIERSALDAHEGAEEGEFTEVKDTDPLSPPPKLEAPQE